MKYQVQSGTQTSYPGCFFYSIQLVSISDHYWDAYVKLDLSCLYVLLLQFTRLYFEIGLPNDLVLRKFKQDFQDKQEFTKKDDLIIVFTFAVSIVLDML